MLETASQCGSNGVIILDQICRLLGLKFSPAVSPYRIEEEIKRYLDRADEREYINAMNGR